MKNTNVILFCILYFLAGSTWNQAQQNPGFAEDRAKIDSFLISASRNEPFKNVDDGLKALAMARRINYKMGESRALRKLSMTYALDYQEEKAINLMEESKDLCFKYGSEIERLNSLADLTVIYRWFNWHKESLDFGNQTLDEAKLLNDSSMIAYSLWNLALIHLELKQHDIHFELAKQALSIYETLNETEYVINLNSHLGAVTENPDSSLQYFNKATLMIPQIKNADVRNKSALGLYGTIASVQSREGNYPETEKAATKAIVIAKKRGNKEAVAVMQQHLARVQFHHYENYQKAIAYMDSSLQYEMSISRYYYVFPQAQFIAKVHAAAGRSKEALEYSELAMLYQDSLYWANRRNDSAEIEKEYELEGQQSEIKLLESQRRTRTILGISMASIFLLFAGFYYRQHQLKSRYLKTEEKLSEQLRKDKAIIELQKNELEISNATKDRLFAIIGHDLRGPLFSLQGLEEQINFLLETGQEKRLKELGANMEQTTKHLSETLNSLLNWSMLQMGKFPYQPESVNVLQSVHSVIALFEAAVDAKGINLNINIPEKIEAQVDRNALNTILRNMFSNALKFSSSGDEIKIEAHNSGPITTIQVSDSGIGMSPSQVDGLLKGKSMAKKRGTRGEKSTGLGWLLLRDLIEQNRGSFQIDSEIGKGTTIKINFPAVQQAIPE